MREELQSEHITEACMGSPPEEIGQISSVHLNCFAVTHRDLGVLIIKYELCPLNISLQ